MAESTEITWRMLYSILRWCGFGQTAELIEGWQDEYIPDGADEPLPRGDGDSLVMQLQKAKAELLAARGALHAALEDCHPSVENFFEKYPKRVSAVFGGEDG